MWHVFGIMKACGSVAYGINGMWHVTAAKSASMA
jgi:hypothetical protein